MKRAIYIGLLLILIILLSSCSMSRAITVTIYNSTRVTTGTLTILYGDYQAEYADGRNDYYNVTFPFKMTIDNPFSHNNYIVYAVLVDFNNNEARRGILIDTTVDAEQNIALDLSLYKINASSTDDYEVDNTYATAGVIQGGEYQAHSLHNSSDDDYISFYAVSGRYYTIESIIHNSSYIQMWLYDPSHSQLAYYSGSYGSEGSLEWLATYTGVCYIMVSSDSSTLSYGISLSWYTPQSSMKSDLLNFKNWSARVK
jgi:hypothetical protein